MVLWIVDDVFNLAGDQWRSVEKRTGVTPYSIEMYNGEDGERLLGECSLKRVGMVTTCADPGRSCRKSAMVHGIDDKS